MIGMNDLINRQDVLDEIIRFSTEEGSSIECQQLYCNINNMHSVIPKGHGRLIIVSEAKLKENQINLDSSCQKWISDVGLSNATVAIIETAKSEKMTREEALKILRYNSNVIHKTIDGRTDSKEVESLDMAIQALGQEPILDKIKAEIEQITDTMGVSYNQYVSKIDVLQILDKYKAESEGKE